jgi:hypothetical protein
MRRNEWDPTARVSLLSASDGNLHSLDRLKQKTSTDATRMGKLGWTVILVLSATVGADQYFNYGGYTDATIAMLRQIEHGFGW